MVKRNRLGYLCSRVEGEVLGSPLDILGQKHLLGMFLLTLSERQTVQDDQISS